MHRFRCAVYPSRTTEHLSLQALMTKDVIKIVAYFGIYNAANGAQFKGTLVFDRYDNVKKQDRNILDEESEIWAQHDVNVFGDDSSMTELDLVIWAEVLLVRHKQGLTHLDFKQNVCLQRKVDFTWTVDKNVLSQWIDCDSRQSFSSPNFPKVYKCFNW